VRSEEPNGVAKSLGGQLWLQRDNTAVSRHCWSPTAIHEPGENFSVAECPTVAVRSTSTRLNMQHGIAARVHSRSLGKMRIVWKQFGGEMAGLEAPARAPSLSRRRACFSSTSGFCRQTELVNRWHRTSESPPKSTLPADHLQTSNFRPAEHLADFLLPLCLQMEQLLQARPRQQERQLSDPLDRLRRGLLQ
jgi:hypothetical protein